MKLKSMVLAALLASGSAFANMDQPGVLQMNYSTISVKSGLSADSPPKKYYCIKCDDDKCVPIKCPSA